MKQLIRHAFIVPGMMLVLVSFLFHYCSLSPDLAGTATETTNGIITSSSGKPVAHAAVRLINAQQWLANIGAGKSVVVESTFTDIEGRFVVHICPLYANNLQIESKDEGLLVVNVHDSLIGAACTLKLVLKEYAGIYGTVDSSATAAEELLFCGSSCRAPVGSDHRFTAENIPAGVFPLVVRRGNPAAAHTALAGVYTLTAGSIVNTGTLSADTGRIPVEDFTLGRERTMLGRVIGGGYWYDMIDTAAQFSGNSFISVNIQTTGAFSGKSLQTKVCLGNGYIYPFGGVGFQIGDPRSSGYDFTRLQKLTFRAKGSGTIRVTLETGLLEQIKDNWDHFGTQVSMPADWTTIEIPVDSLKLIPGSPAYLQGAQWKSACSSLLRVEFAVMHQFTAIGDTVEYWLDDIRCEGVSIGSLVH